MGKRKRREGRLKFPRHYYYEIKERPVSEWKSLLEKVPKHFQVMVREFLLTEYLLYREGYKKCRRRKQK